MLRANQFIFCWWSLRNEREASAVTSKKRLDLIPFDVIRLILKKKF